MNGIRAFVIFAIVSILFFPIVIVIDTVTTQVENASTSYGNSNVTDNVTTHMDDITNVFRIYYSIVLISSVTAIIIYAYYKKRREEYLWNISK